MSRMPLRDCLLSTSALCALTLFALLPASPATAATRTVGNCNDIGPGSLRNVVAGAASGDRIDLTALECDRIVLTSGAIEVSQNDLELVGRNRWSLTIDGNQADRVFAHTGAGTLRIKRLSIANGRHEIPGKEGFAAGGCIHSNAAVELSGAQVHHCTAYIAGFWDSQAHGGGVYAAQLVRLSYSRVFANTAGEYGFGGGVAGSVVVLHRSQVYGNSVEGQGGGVLAYSHAELVHSTVHDNQAHEGAGIYAAEVTVRNSTVSGNRAVLREFLGGHWPTGGGIHARNGAGQSTISNSTISGNSADYSSAAYFAGDAAIYNSTITANEITLGFESEYCGGDGALVGGMQLRLESTIVAGNSCIAPSPNYDIGGGSIVGSHNLIGTSMVPVPGDTISADPQLGPLANNGGPTATHALLGGSPAINHGSNPLHCKYDQRGPGFPRVKKLRADIGAYER